MTAAELVDAVAKDRLVVFGRLPPAGRDVDLVASRAAVPGLIANLQAQGYVGGGGRWLRLPPEEPAAVEIVTPDRWGLSESAQADLFDQAVPLPGYRSLCRPAPHHALLIIARRSVRAGVLDESLRSRLTTVEAEQPDCWRLAADAAPDWAADHAVTWLRLESRRPGSAGTALRLRALCAGHAGAGRSLPWLRAVRQLMPPGHRGRVVALSGLDGAGKSGQAALLAEALHSAGADPVVVWSRLGSSPLLDRLADAPRRLLALVPTGPDARPVVRYAPGAAPAPPGRLQREQSRTVSWCWSLVVTVEAIRTLRRAVQPARRKHDVVICDRWLLDSAVALTYRYGMSTDLRLQQRLLRLALPVPAASVFLDVPADVAFRRKQEQYALDQLAQQAALYVSKAGTLGAVRVDGDRDTTDVHRDVLELVWTRLSTGAVG
jgi:thymidylate kinase